jgi:hypothetical protein
VIFIGRSPALRRCFRGGGSLPPFPAPLDGAAYQWFSAAKMPCSHPNLPCALPEYAREGPMPPIILTPLLKWTLVALGGAMAVHWVVKEVRRINEELDQAKRVPIPETNRRTLRRDPLTGDYRL